MLVKDGTGNRLDKRVGDPCPIVSSSDLSKLVRTNLFHRHLICLGVVLDRNLSGHATHGSDFTPMACLDEQTNVRVHEMHGHGDIFAVWENGVAVSPALFDEAENIIPAKNRM